MQSAFVRRVQLHTTTFCRIKNKRSLHVERKVKVKDTDINIVECGQGTKTVLLMPGIMGSIWTDFSPQIRELPKLLPNHTIIAWDPPGYGKSVPPTREWRTDSLQIDAEYAVDLMKSLNKSTFSIIGWSAGGTTGLIAANRYPEMVEKLVIWGSGAYMSRSELQLYDGMRDVSKWPAKMRNPMEEIYGVERFSKLWNDLVDTLFKLPNGDVCTNELNAIEAPTLILHGRKDPMKPFEHVAYLREHLKNTRYYEFPDGKHNIHIAYANTFNRLVSEFLLDTSLP
ncbi:valacyclovir hydrolase-like [Musca vetustissima]|uniref:valacyclovir hydrolase-like n=1 Tax=Musca vetustissima TaxID=27455 RepID=UPI002AB63031|nr:valacyclovir hydrolase-like [Musca vetustissima]